MADIQNATGDVTLYDELGNKVGVTQNIGLGKYELNVSDVDAIDALQGIETQTDKLTFTGTRLQVDTVAQDTTSPPQSNDMGFWSYNGRIFSVCASVNMATSATDNPLFLIKNPAGSGRILFIYKITAGLNIANQYANVRLWKSPTITANGTSATIVNNSVGNTETTVAQAYTIPTISANGDLMRNEMSGQNTNSVSLTEDFSVSVLEGYNVLITGAPKDNNRPLELMIAWAEMDTT
jgi:hypothetical protein